MTDPLDDAAPDAALARRLRDDHEAARRLEELRRTAYGRDGSTAPLVEVPADLRARTGYDEAELPAPLVALLAEEARLVDEGQALLAAERPAHAATPSAAAPEADPDPAPAPDADADADADGTPRAPDPSARRLLLRPGALAGAAAGILLVIGLGVASTAGAFDDPTAASPTTAPGATSTPRGQAMGTPDGRRVSPVPAFTATPPPHTPASEEEMPEAYRREADSSWELFSTLADGGAVRPDVTLERVVSEEDFPDQQVECLRSEGIEASVVGGGGITYDDGDPIAIWSCQARFPMEQPEPLDDAELAYLHDYIVSFLLPCYAVEGEPYTGPVPSREDFIAEARASYPWSPTPDRMTGALSSRCPSQPPGMG
ncbi:hypothetical protein BFL34_03051 [Clavibacter michiganensis]|uniref:Uncharacterized protein n=1 Tax=Clavibacter michiganensis TaxID=28447 RepID=A0A251Y1S9_9MICO|nr:hypothetical protein [Clavibacter michiganensis]OUE18003.1 hypothetical protein BFL34_03051 [Clavibacter michiganensis]